ncbi:MAG: plastocyanin/azurin family copper-binding protein [Candidatus Magasanikiibacteriota bacterium]
MNKYILIPVISFLLVGAGCNSVSQPTASSSTVNLPANNQQTPNQNVNEVSFDVVGKPFSFNQKNIEVKEGDKVTINFINSEGTHDFVLDEFNVKTPVINVGEKSSVTFVASKVGTFEYYCSVGNHRAMGMKGTLTVKAKN